MRALTAQQIPFSFSFATYNRETCKSAGVRHVKEALLRPAASADSIVDADFKLFFIDREIDEARTCWQMLIMTFNGKKVILR